MPRKLVHAQPLMNSIRYFVHSAEASTLPSRREWLFLDLGITTSEIDFACAQEAIVVKITGAQASPGSNFSAPFHFQASAPRTRLPVLPVQVITSPHFRFQVQKYPLEAMNSHLISQPSIRLCCNLQHRPAERPHLRCTAHNGRDNPEQRSTCHRHQRHNISS